MSKNDKITKIYEEATKMAFNDYIRKGFVHEQLKKIIQLAALLQLAQSHKGAERPRVPAGYPDGGEWLPGGGDKHPNRSNRMNINKAIEHLMNTTKNKIDSGKECAKYVRRAIQAGGVDLKEPYPELAKDYGPYLEQYGFSKVWPTPEPNHKPHRGDIVVIQALNEEHDAGHIEMYSGTQWLSDFRQRGHDIWPGHSYREISPSYAVYRQEGTGVLGIVLEDF